MDTLSIGTDELVFRVTSEESEGALLAVEVRLPAGGGPPALHRHAAAEVYRVERGELAIYVEDDRIAATPGTVVNIPGGRAHTVRNESGADAHAYVVFTPGTEIERFFRAAAALTDPAEVMPLAERHGIEMLRSRSTPPTG
jgi:mannose-6-phosphate isomerase-like protein (cupin superfamily)